MTDSHNLYLFTAKSKKEFGIANHGHKNSYDKASIRWENRVIINCSYSFEYKILLLLCDDSRLYVLTSELELITKIEWESKFSVCF